MSKFGLDPYAGIGLIENPFIVHALSADERGKRLLVGRDDEVTKVAQRLHKHGKITCLDGHVGVGKTSLVNVAAYECYQAYLQAETSQLLIPAVTSFQLKKDGNVDQFCAEVFQGVAQTLLKYQKELAHFDYDKEKLPHLNAWLNSPIVQHLTITSGSSAGIGIPGVISAGIKSDRNATSQINQSSGFTQTGFESLVKSWLSEIFSNQGNGGVVCVIDNIELLETGITARRMLEALRDKLFNVVGLRWVFCGANGVIHSLAASPRLTAFLSTPVLNISNINSSFLDDLIRARLQEFSSDPQRAEDELAITLDDLKFLYKVVNHNLRDLMGLADEFCEYSAQSGKPLRSRETKSTKFARWLELSTTERYNALSSRISQNAWAVLDIAMSNLFEGTFGTGDYTTFNQNSTIPFEQGTFNRWLRELVKLGLLSKTIDDESGEDDGFTRDVFSVTAKGALVHYARRKKKETYSLAADVEWMRRVHHR